MEFLDSGGICKTWLVIKRTFSIIKKIIIKRKKEKKKERKKKEKKKKLTPHYTHCFLR